MTLMTICYPVDHLDCRIHGKANYDAEKNKLIKY